MVLYACCHTNVMKWTARIPIAIKIRPWGKKHLLKKGAARRIPEQVIYRRKHGFSIPLNKWFAGKWSSWSHEIILGKTARSRGLFNYDYIEQLWHKHQSRAENHGTRLWLLLWLELWLRMFIDGTMSPDDTLID